MAEPPTFLTLLRHPNPLIEIFPDMTHKKVGNIDRADLILVTKNDYTRIKEILSRT